jgi:predicted amidophosphoribosyltransferase
VSTASRERRTLQAMIALYCAGLHGKTPRDADGLCPDCAATFAYARKRAASCRYGEEKTVCSACATHCYRPDMRERVRAVMRYAGPRMLLRHPVLALLHALHALRRSPGGR